MEHSKDVKKNIKKNLFSNKLKIKQFI